MGVRSVRFYDLLAVRRIEANRGAHVLWPSTWTSHSATYLALASAWQDVNQTLFTFVLREKGEILGLAQGAARPGHDAWDLLRLALVPADPEDRERAADALLEQCAGRQRQPRRAAHIRPCAGRRRGQAAAGAAGLPPLYRASTRLRERPA